MRAWLVPAFLCVALPFAANAADDAASLPVNPSSRAKLAAKASMSAAAVPAGAIPVPNPEQVFVAITPCRVFDTRPSKILTGPRGFLISGSGNFLAQGGTDGGCGVPASATAITISLTATSSSVAGSMVVNPSGVLGRDIAVSYRPGDSETSGYVVGLGADGRIAVKPSAGQTHLTGDVTGYFAPQIAGYMNPDGTVYSGTARIVSSQRIKTGSHSITVDRDIGTCSVTMNIAGGTYYGTAYPSSSTVQISTWYLDADAQPIPVDVYYNFAVHC